MFFKNLTVRPGWMTTEDSLVISSITNGRFRKTEKPTTQSAPQLVRHARCSFTTRKLSTTNHDHQKLCELNHKVCPPCSELCFYLYWMQLHETCLLLWPWFVRPVYKCINNRHSICTRGSNDDGDTSVVVWTGEVLASTVQGEKEDVDLAVSAARRAYESWSKSSGHYRARILYR